MKTRMLVLVAVAAAGVAGCGDPTPPDAGAAAPAVMGEAAKPESGFATAEALLDHLRGFSEATDAFGLLDLVYARSRAERTTVQRVRERETARLAFDHALRQRFPLETAEVPPEDLGMRAFAASLRGVGVDRVAGRRVYVPHAGRDGGKRELVMIRYRDSWWIAPETLAGGTRIDDVWFLPRHEYLVGVPRIYTQMADAIRQGRFGSPREARDALATALAGDMPQVGPSGNLNAPSRPALRDERPEGPRD